MRKALPKVVLFVVLGLLVLVLAGWLALDSAVETAVEKGGTYALGVDTKLGSADASVVRGDVTLKKLEIANVPGFEAPFFLQVGRTSLDVSPASLMKDTVEVPSFQLDDVEVHLERTTKGTNYDAILESLKRFEGKDKSQPAEGEGEGKKFIVREILIRNVVVHANVAPGVLGKSGHFSVTIPEIRLSNVGTGEGGQSIAKLTSELVKALLAAAVKAGAGVFPDGMLDGLSNALGNLGRTLTDTLGGGLEKIGEGAGKALEGLGKELDKVFK
jgi:hypothetical protein